MELNYKGLKIVDMEMNFSISYPGLPKGRSSRILPSDHSSFKQDLEAIIATDSDPTLVETCREFSDKAEAVEWDFPTLCQTVFNERLQIEQPEQ